jgi:hypothetical protein
MCAAGSLFPSSEPFFAKKYQNSNFQIFHKSWLREVHARQRILEFEVFIIFVYLFLA